ncbi:MAG: CoB--CoM heterodisulfide reductase iron-sulfur subunit B family protein [Desulfobacterales bacterium]|nr:CoB--CoM heterodisulfide reductase iron-sulfur subunit B family protein [Desulfobacterales bacterium]
MKKFALFIGCNIPVKVKQYELSAKAVLKKLNIEVADIDSFNCCGYPLKNIDQAGWLLSSARNIAIAEKKSFDLLILCKCCFGSLKKADAMLKENNEAKIKVNKILSKEGLQYQGTATINHLLSILHNDITIKVIEEKIIDKYKELNIATHYGCHALRPSDIMDFDDPANPSLFDNLVNVTGAKSIEWESKLDCCGAPVLGINDNLSYDLTEKKISNAKNAGADFLCVACPWCQMQFDKIQDQIASKRGNVYNLPSILYTQLLGLRLGISKEALGIENDQKDETLNLAFQKLFETQEKKVKKAKKEKKAGVKVSEKKVETEAEPEKVK